MSKRVDIIIVNWNSGRLTLQAAAPYLNYQSPAISCKVIIADNASTDDSASLFKNVFNDVIYNNTNYGFGKACNIAFKKSDGDYILLLNPDTLSKPIVLETLVDFLEKNPGYGCAGPQQVDEKGFVLRTCVRFPTFKTSVFEILGLSKLFPSVFTPAPIMTDWDHLESRNVDHVMGSYMLIRKSVLDKIGFMDESYFTYYEDIDLSKRIKQHGYKVYYHTANSIFHAGGGSGQKVESLRLFYSLSSRRIYWKKYLGKTKTFLLTLLSVTIEPFLRIIDSFLKEKKFRFKKIGKAYYLYIKQWLNQNDNAL